MFIIGSVLFVFWSIVFAGSECFIPGSTEVDLEVRKRSVAMVRGLFSVFLSGGFLLRNGLEFCVESSSEERVIVLFSLIFFSIESVICWLKGFWDKNLVIHHSCSLVALLLVFLAPFGAKYTVYGLLAADISNFPMNLRGIIRAKGKRHTRLHEVMECSYMALYMVFRGFLAPYNIYSCLSCRKISVLLTLISVFLTAQSWFFISKMLNIVKKKALEYEERRAKGVSLWWLEVNPAQRSLLYFNKIANHGIF